MIGKMETVINILNAYAGGLYVACFNQQYSEIQIKAPATPFRDIGKVTISGGSFRVSMAPFTGEQTEKINAALAKFSTQNPKEPT